MASAKQIAANKKNSGKSTGPKTEQGKMAVRFNALKRGATAALGLLPDEDPEEQDQFKNALFENFAPKDQAQKDLVWLIADGLWRLRRFSRIEAGVLTWHTYEFMRTRLEQKSGAAAQACAERSLSAKQAAIDDLQANLDYAAIAFMADVNGPNTLGNLSRYETTLANRTMKYMADLHKLQSNQVSTSS